MAVFFFGQYLRDKGVITASALDAAVAHQEKVNPMMGDFLVTRGAITAEQQRQWLAELRRTGSPYPLEVLEKLGYITADKFKEHLEAFWRDRVVIGDALIQQGALTPEVRDRELAEYRQQQEGIETLIVPSLPPRFYPEALTRAAHVKTTVDRPVIFGFTAWMLYFMGRLRTRLTPVESSVSALPAAFFEVGVNFKGDLGGEFLLRASEDVLREVATAILGRERPLDHAAQADALAEVANVVAGGICGFLERSGQKAEIAPPVQTMNAPARTLPAHLTGQRCDIHLCYGGVLEAVFVSENR
jgi:hypothetical protein